MHRSTVTLGAAALALTLAACSQTPQAPAASSATNSNQPFNAETGQPISQAEFEGLLKDPNTGKYTITASKAGISAQAVASCTIVNTVYANRRDIVAPYNYLKTVDGNAYASCTETFAYISVQTRLEDTATYANVQRTKNDQLRTQTNAYAGSLSRTPGRRYALYSAAAVSFLSGGTASGTGPPGYDTAFTY